MAKRKGQDLFLKLATSVVDCMTNVDINIIREILDATTHDSSENAREKLSGEKDGNITVEGKWEEGTSNYSIEDLIDAIDAGTAVAFIAGGVTAGDMTLSGSCLLSNLRLGGGRGNIANWTCNMEITGPITRGTVSE